MHLLPHAASLPAEPPQDTAEQAQFSLAGLLRQVAIVVGAAARRKGVALTVVQQPDVPGLLVGSSAGLSRILTNLGCNAVMFTERGEVLVDVSVSECTDSWVVLAFKVVDTGIGMTEGQLFALLSPPPCINSRIGYGFVSSRQLIEQMGGSITVRSIPDLGTTCQVELPFGYCANATQLPRL